MTHITRPHNFKITHKILTLLLSCIIALLPTLQVFALPDHLLDTFDANDIFYHDPTGNASDCDIPEDPIASDSSGMIKTSKGLSPLQSAFVDRYHSIAIRLGKEYGIPWETAMAQGILESASGTSPFARERNNFFGIGAYDSNPDNARHYPTPSLGWRGYFSNIHKTKVYAKHGALNHPNDPYAYLAAIKSAGYATDPKYIAKVTPLIRAIEHRAQQNNWPLSRDLDVSTLPKSNFQKNLSTLSTFCSNFATDASNALSDKLTENATKPTQNSDDSTNPKTSPKQPSTSKTPSTNHNTSSASVSYFSPSTRSFVDDTPRPSPSTNSTSNTNNTNNTPANHDSPNAPDRATRAAYEPSTPQPNSNQNSSQHSTPNPQTTTPSKPQAPKKPTNPPNPLATALGDQSINQVALSLSWPKRGNNPNNPNPAYRAALAATGVNKLGDSCSMIGKSCDAFVATVLRYSGADRNIPCCGAARMLKYFQSRPDLYQEIPNLGNTSNILPGDIRSKRSHVEIIVKKSGGFRIASASHCDRTADHGVNFYPDSAYKIFRRKPKK